MNISHIIGYLILGYVGAGLFTVILLSITHPELVHHKSKISFYLAFVFWPIVLLVSLLGLLYNICGFVSNRLGDSAWRFLDFTARLSPTYWHGESPSEDEIKSKAESKDSDAEFIPDSDCNCTCRGDRNDNNFS